MPHRGFAAMLIAHAAVGCCRRGEDQVGADKRAFCAVWPDRVSVSVSDERGKHVCCTAPAFNLAQYKTIWTAVQAVTVSRAVDAGEEHTSTGTCMSTAADVFLELPSMGKRGRNTGRASDACRIQTAFGSSQVVLYTFRCLGPSLPAVRNDDFPDGKSVW